MTFTDDMTLADARAELRTLVEKGHECPCCRQFAKVYRRKITSTSAASLIRIYRAVGMEYCHIPSVIGRQSADETKASAWGLIEARGGVRDDGSKKTGWWRITEKGRDWITGQIVVPKYIRYYNGRVISVDDGVQVSMRDALGTKFNYNELMEGI